MSIYTTLTKGSMEEKSTLIGTYKHAYENGTPFPNCILQSLLDEDMADDILAEWPKEDDERWGGLNQNLLNANAGMKREITKFELLGPRTREAVMFFQSGTFCEFLEQVTGIKGLVPDPHLFGGGLNAIPTGGMLKVHADFNFYHRINLYRRVNVIYYLNKDWDPSWGGGLELWDEDMKECVTTIPCVFNTGGMFGVTDKTFHGYPDPITCPKDRERKGINLYYYSVEPDCEQSRDPHRTLWENRPGENTHFTGY